MGVSDYIDNISLEACKFTHRADLPVHYTFLHSISIVSLEDKRNIKTPLKTVPSPSAVARLEACPLGMQAAPSSIPTSGTFFLGDSVMKKFLRPFSLFH